MNPRKPGTGKKSVSPQGWIPLGLGALMFLAWPLFSPLALGQTQQKPSWKFEEWKEDQKKPNSPEQDTLEQLRRMDKKELQKVLTSLPPEDRAKIKILLEHKASPGPGESPGEPKERLFEQSAEDQASPSEADVSEYMKNLKETLGASQEYMKQLEEIYALANSPGAKKLYKIMGDEPLREKLSEIKRRAKLKFILIGQIVLFIGYIIFKSWRLSRAQHWAHRLWVGFYSVSGFILGSTLGIPLLFIGKPYWEFLQRLTQLIIFHYL